MKKITFFDWECPPRKLRRNPQGRFFLDFGVDLDIVFAGKKIDKFTEIPRIVRYKKLYRRFLSKKVKNFECSFYFLVADTNASILFPVSADNNGSRLVNSQMENFRKKIESAAKNLPGFSGALLFSKIINKKQYRQYFNMALNLIKRGGLINKQILAAQQRRTAQHIGLIDPRANLSVSQRIIASYAAEGMVFADLNNSGFFGNCVWLNSSENDRRTFVIANALRRYFGLADLSSTRLR